MTGFRRFLLNFHLCVGLGICILVFLLGITGAALIFEYQIDRLANHSLAYTTPQGTVLSLDELEHRVADAYPGSRIATADLSSASPSPDLTYSFTVVKGRERLQVFVDQYTGRVLGARDPSRSLAQRIHQFHTNLLAGPALKTPVTCGSILMGLLAITGIYLWWPRKILRPNLRASGRRINFDLHNAIGFYVSIFVFIFAFTSIVIRWENELVPFANWVTHSHVAPEAKPTSAAVPPGTHPISLDRVRQISEQEMNGARPTLILIPALPKDVFRVWMRYPGDDSPAGRNWIVLDQFSGHVISTSLTAPVGLLYVQGWNRGIHTGDILGWPTKIIAFLSSLAIAFLAVSGPLIWILKKVRKNSSSAPRSSQRALEQQPA